MARNDDSFSERQKTSAKAKQDQLARVRAAAAAKMPGLEERQAQRRAVSEARAERKSAADARKQAEIARKAEEKQAALLAAQREADAARLAKEAEEAQRVADAVALKAKQKAGRDAKYKARQERRDQRRK